MNKSLPRLTTVAFGLLFVFLSRTTSQVLTIDYSNLSAVKFTATANNSAINYPGGTSWTFSEGVALLGFLSSPANVQDLDLGSPTGTSNLTDSANLVTGTSTFNRLSSWNDANPSFYPNLGNGSDLTLWNNSTATVMTFTTASTAFNGEAIFNLSSYSSFTNLFPALNATGNVGIWNGSGTLGTWQVVAVPVPEPSTYAALFGVCALAGAMIIRRKRDVG